MYATTSCTNPVHALLNDFVSGYRFSKSETRFRPAVEIEELNETYRLTMELPGFEKSAVSLSIDENVLTISGERASKPTEEKRYFYSERSTGSFERRFNLPEDIDQAGITAEMVNGELTISLPKVEKTAPKKIAISIQ